MATISSTAKAASSGEPKKLSIAGATGLMMVMVLLSRILGVLRDAIISHYFGRGPLTDAYNAAFTVPDLLFYLLQSGALSSTIVPIITEYRQQGDHKSADHTVSIVASTIFVVIGLLICIMWIYARQLTIILNPGFDAHRIALSVPLTRILLPAQIFFFIGGLMMGVIYSRKEFLIPAAGPVIYNSGIIFGGIVLRHWFGIEGLVWGALGGAFVGNFLLPFLRVQQYGVRLVPSFDITNPAAVKVWKLLLPMGLGVALPNIDQIVNKLFASYLGAGATTAMMNSYRLMLLPIGIFAQAMALAVYPTMSSHAAQKNIPALRTTMNASLRNILFLTVPASVLMFVLSDAVITFLLQSGKYTAADAHVTAAVLRMLSIGIFAWSAQSLLTRGFYALQNSRIPVASGIVASAIFVLMNYLVVFHSIPWWRLQVVKHTFVLKSYLLFVHSHPGVGGLGMATSAAATLNAVSLLIWLRMRLKGIEGARLARSVTGTVLATTMLALVTVVLRHETNLAIPSSAPIFVWILAHGGSASVAHIFAPKLQALVVILVSGLGGLAAFLATARLLRMEELNGALAILRRRSGGSGGAGNGSSTATEDEATETIVAETAATETLSSE